MRAAAVAEAWFGQPVDRTTAEQLARVLEAAGLVRRDDHRRDRLWVLGVSESGLFPEEAERETQLKMANPKGRLLEFCSRVRIDPPVADIEMQGAFYEARMSLDHAGRRLESGPFRAASKKTAEQMAAAALLAAIAEDKDTGETRRLADDDAARLQAANPKGKLLEWCAQSKTPPPDFQRDASADGYRIRAVLAVGGREPIATAWYVSAKLKLAEHAAAEEVLQWLPQEPAAEAPQAAPLPQTTAAVASEASRQRNPVGALNELRQAGVLESAGFELLEQAGPSHQPTFMVVAWARLPDGRTLQSEPAGAPSKKAAQAASADRLLGRLADDGLTRW